MAATNKTGALIKQARTAAGLSQEKLAKAVGDIKAADIGKAERGEKALTQAVLKKIAKAVGITQASLLNAAKEDAANQPAVKKTTTTTAKKTTTTTAKKTTAKKTTTTTSSSTMKVSAAEKKLVEAYRTATSNAKKAALYLLQGESGHLLDNIIANHTGGSAISNFVEDLVESIAKK